MSDYWKDALNLKDSSKMQKSSEWDEMMIKFNDIANELLNTYGPEGSYEISQILEKLIIKDVFNSEIHKTYGKCN